MDDRSGFCERGFTLIEIVIAVGIVATTVAAGVGLTLASRSFAVAAAATEFDHLLDSARTIAREVQGATLAFVPDAYGDGTEVRVLAGGASSTLTPTTLPPLHTRAVIEELESLHQAPFAFVVHVNGALGGRPGFRVSDKSASAEVGCPASGAFHFVIHAAGGSADRYVPCRVTLAANGPVTFVTMAARAGRREPDALRRPMCSRNIAAHTVVIAHVSGELRADERRLRTDANSKSGTTLSRHRNARITDDDGRRNRLFHRTSNANEPKYRSARNASVRSGINSADHGRYLHGLSIRFATVRDDVYADRRIGWRMYCRNSGGRLRRIGSDCGQRFTECHGIRIAKRHADSEAMRLGRKREVLPSHRRRVQPAIYEIYRSCYCVRPKRPAELPVCRRN